jgi:ectoine hydroxylase-related dioxygenase (phytanoyl-CoA dioxygenase family)
MTQQHPLLLRTSKEKTMNFMVDNPVTKMKNFYDDNGYLCVENVFTDDDLAALKARIEEIIQDPSHAPVGVKLNREGDTVADKASAEAQNQAVRGMAFMARYDDSFRAAARHAPLLQIVRALIGPRVKVFRDQMLLKPPGGQAKPVHQDQSYFRVQPVDALVTAWIALDDATLDNGCMVYVPGSHRHSRIFEVVPDPARPVHHIPRTDGLQLESEVSCPVPRGSVIFHHGLTLHRSEVNRTNDWRRALIFHYATSESRSENETLNEQVTLEID